MIEAITNLIAVTVWPLTTLAAIIVFQKDIKIFFHRIQSAKVGSVELKIEDKIQEVVDEAISLADDPNVLMLDNDSENDEDYQQDKYSLLVGLRRNLQNLIKNMAVEGNIVSEDNKNNAPISWLIQKIKYNNKSLQHELDTVGKIISSAEEALKNSDVSYDSVNELSEASNLIINKLKKNKE